MPLIQFQLPNGITTIDHDRAMERLVDSGITSVVGLLIPGDGTVSVELTDVSEAVQLETAIAQYQDQPTRREQFEDQLLQDARQLIIAIKNKGPANWTNQEKIILAMALQLRELKSATE